MRSITQPNRTLSLTRSLLLLLVTTSLLTGCGKDSGPQPADSDFAGTYKGKMVLSLKSANQTNNQTVDELTVEVKPSSTPGTFTVQLFEDSFGELSDPLTATASGNKLTLAKQKTPGYPDSEYEGNGILTGKALAMTVTIRYFGYTETGVITVTKP